MVHKLWIGFSLQVLFLILFFGAILSSINNILGVSICLIISLISLFFAIKSLKEQYQPVISMFVILSSVMILLFTIFAYLIPEGGMPPLIMQ